MKTWTPEDEDWLWENRHRFPDKFSAEKLGHTEQAIRLKALRMKKQRTDRKPDDLSAAPSDSRNRIGVVYLMQGRGTSSYKIGFTARLVERRLARMNQNSAIPVDLVGVRDGSIRDERAYHARLDQYRSHGEWFLLPDEVVKEIRADFDSTMGCPETSIETSADRNVPCETAGKAA